MMRIMLAVSFLWNAVPAHAQAICGPRDRLVEVLAAKFQEYPTSRALSGKEWLVETFTSAKGTWTQLTSGTDHIACITAAGDSWENLNPTKQGDKT
jgi:hypothetical protein